MKENKHHARWATNHDQFGDLSDVLCGSREGLAHLREKIDEALRHGESHLDDGVSFDFTTIKVEEAHPRTKVTVAHVRDALIKTAFLCAVAIALILMGLGVRYLWGAITQ